VFGAAVVTVMAVVAGLVTLYLWLVPLVGAVAAAGIVSGGLLLIAVVLGVSAMMVANKRIPPLEPPKLIQPELVTAEETVSAPSSASFRPPGVSAEPSPRPVAPHDVESLFAIAGQFARLPRTGIEPADNIIQAFAPHAEDATREAVARAANLVRYGDRSTVIGILSAAAAVGWILSKTATSK
jgi:hypothetical protein